MAQPLLNLPAGPVRAALAHCGQQHSPFPWQKHLVTKLCPGLCPGGALARCHSSPRTANTELQLMVKGIPKILQYRPVLRPRVRGMVRLRYFEAVLQVNTYAVTKRAGGCFPKNVFILCLKQSSAFTSEFRPLINQL